MTDSLVQVQGVISLASLNHLNARRVAQCANGVYNPAFHRGTPVSECCNETITFQLREKKKLLKESPAVDKPEKEFPNLRVPGDSQGGGL